MRINQETREHLECYPSSLFYDETPLHSGLTNNYGLDSKITKDSPKPLSFTELSVPSASQPSDSLHSALIWAAQLMGLLTNNSSNFGLCEVNQEFAT